MPTLQLPEFLNIPPKLYPLITELDNYKFFLIDGGRVSAKTQTVARLLLYLADQYKLRAVCGREIQNSIEESVYAVLVDLIRQHNLAFNIGATKIDHASSGSLLRFKGFRDQGKVNIKGLEGVHLLWIDEAQQLSKETLDIIIPTLRKDNAKIFFTMNRTLKDDPVFVAMKDDPDCLHIHIDYFENPHCPDTSKREAEKQKARNIEDYNHIWLGEPLPQALNAAFRGVDACATGELCEPVKGDEYVLGVDLARSVDYTVLSILNKKTKNFDYIERLENENRTSWNYQVEKIKAVAQKYNNAQVIVDSTGVGDPIVENLQREGVNVYYHQKPDSDTSTPGIKFSSINKENLIEKLKVAIELKLITYPNIKYYVDELREFICETTSAGRHKYSAPDGKHDDCFVKGTMVLTNIGNVPIESIKVGDLVLTRNGYNPVIMTRNRYKRVIGNIGLTGTPDHPVITTEGEKGLQDVSESDTIYIWNEKLLSIEKKNITDTRCQNEDSYRSIIGDMINGKHHHFRFIVKYGLIVLVIFQKVLSCIIRTIIHSTMLSAILKLSRQAHTDHSTCLLQKEKQSHLRTQVKTLRTCCEVGENGERQKRQSHFSVNMQAEQYTTQRHKMQSVFFVQRNLHTLLNEVFDSVAGFAMLVSTGKRKVYNLQVANSPEYFANNILVHNCVISCALAVWGIRDQIYYKEPVIVVPTGADKFWGRVTKDLKKHNNSLHGEENEVNIEADGEDISE